MRIEGNIITFEFLQEAVRHPGHPADEERSVSADMTLEQPSPFSAKNAKGDFAQFSDVEKLYSTACESADNMSDLLK